MDLVEITWPSELADYANCIDGNITNWFKHNWENYVLSRYKRQHYEDDEPICIDDIQFRVGDDLIILSEGAYEKEPHTDISSHFGGRLTTLVMIARIFITDAKLKGKMRIYNASRPPIDTTYELSLNNVDLLLTIGLRIRGDGWNFDHCNYQFVRSDLSFKYLEGSKEISLFERETNIYKRKLLEQYMLEYITKDLGPAIEDFMLSRLAVKCLVSNSVGASYRMKNSLSIHNKKMRKAFKILSEKIICIANSLLVRKSPKLECSEFFSLIEDTNKEKNFKVYSGFIDQFDSLAFSQCKNAIISNDGDLVIVHVPVEFENLKLHITEFPGRSSVEYKEQTYKTSGSYFIMSIKRLSQFEVKMYFVNFKVLGITPTSEISINVAMDHFIIHAIEEHVKPFLEEAVAYNELQEWAINQEVEISLDCEDDLSTEISIYTDNTW